MGGAQRRQSRLLAGVLVVAVLLLTGCGNQAASGESQGRTGHSHSDGSASGAGAVEAPQGCRIEIGATGRVAVFSGHTTRSVVLRNVGKGRCDFTSTPRLWVRGAGRWVAVDPAGSLPVRLHLRPSRTVQMVISVPSRCRGQKGRMTGIRLRAQTDDQRSHVSAQATGVDVGLRLGCGRPVIQQVSVR